MTSLLSLYLPTQSANANANVHAAVPFKCTVLSAKFVPDADLTADGTNFATLTLGANAGSGAYSAIATAVTTETDDVTAAAGVAFTLSAPHLAAGSIVQLAKTYDGTGLAVAGTLVLELERVH